MQIDELNEFYVDRKKLSDLKEDIEIKTSELNKLQDEYRKKVGKNYVVPLRLS